MPSHPHRHNILSQNFFFRFFLTTGVQLFRFAGSVSSSTPSRQTIQSPCTNASITSSLFTASRFFSIAEPRLGFRGLIAMEGDGGPIFIFATSRRSGLVSSILVRIVRSLNAVLRRPPLPVLKLFVCEYVDRTRDHDCSFVLRVRAHSYLSYLPTKIHPPPSPRRGSTCHFPMTPLGSLSNLNSLVPDSTSLTRVLRIEWVSRLTIGRILGREESAFFGDGRSRWTWRF